MATNDETPILTNRADRDEKIESTFKKRLKLLREIDKLKEEHITPLQQENREAWATLATQLGITKKDLNIRFALYKRLEDTYTFDDEDDGAEVRDALRELFGKLKIGESLDLFEDVAAAAGAGQGAAGKPAANSDSADKPALDRDRMVRISTSEDLESARAMGAAHAANDRGKTNSPFEPDTDDDLSYHWGYWRETGRLEREFGMPLEANPHTAGTMWWTAYDEGWSGPEPVIEGDDTPGTGEATAADPEAELVADTTEQPVDTVGDAADLKVEQPEPATADETDTPVAEQAEKEAEDDTEVTDPALAVVEGKKFKNARLEGMQAFLDDAGFGSCPYSTGDDKLLAWRWGWWSSEAGDAHTRGLTLADCPSSEGTMAHLAWSREFEARSGGSLIGAEGTDVDGERQNVTSAEAAE